MMIDTAAITILQSFRNPFFDFLALFLSYLFSTTVIIIFFIIETIMFILRRYKRMFVILFSTFASFVTITLIKY